MSEISPLGAMLLRILRLVTLGAAALLLLFLAISIWQGFHASKPDYGFDAILAVMLFGALWLYRSMGRELKNPGA
jgi:peptidoglycan/LPS O-acetylase OafA/YrhL